MINQLLKLGALLATGRFLKQRIRGLLVVLAVWLVLWLVHGEFVSYVELSGDTSYVLHATLLKVLLYALTIGIYVLRVERPLWPKAVHVSAPPAKVTATAKPAALPPGDDGFDFLRQKKKLKDPARDLLGKK
jgi:hypothetical protein